MTNKTTHYIIDKELSGGNTEVYREYVAVEREAGIGGYSVSQKTLNPTGVLRIDGKRYRLADRRAEVGEKIIHKRDGDVSVVTAVGGDRAYTRRFEGYGMDHGHYYVLLPLGIEQTETDAQTLIANLASEVARLTRKVTELEEQVDSNRKDIIKQAEEFAELNGLVEALETQEYTLSEESADKVAEHLLTEVLMRERRFK